MAQVVIEKPNEQEQVQAEWQAFSQTLAYQKLMDYIEIQKEAYNNLAAGPLEVGTMTTEEGVNFAFEPEKYAYLLQRGVGCDIVKIYINGYTEDVRK